MTVLKWPGLWHNDLRINKTDGGKQFVRRIPHILNDLIILEMKLI